MGEIYSTIGGFALMVALISGVAYGITKRELLGKIFKVSGIIFVALLVADIAYDKLAKPPSAEKPQPTPTTVEQPREKPKPKVERPEENFYYESYTAIAEKTGMLVTDSWLLEYGEYVSKTGEVNTHGFVELNGDGVKRQFWLTFDGATRRVVRVKIGPDLIYSESGR